MKPSFPLKTPFLQINESRCRSNIQKMALKCKKGNVVFRPHFKTHQSAAVGNWFRDYSCEKITVSSVEMAMYFIRNGWNDVLIAFPFNINETKDLNEISEKVNIGILVESQEVVDFLSRSLNRKVDVYVKVDIGYHRAGIHSENREEILSLAKVINSKSKMHFVGLLSHAGHTYHVESSEEVLEIANKAIKRLNILSDYLDDHHVENFISYGDTPSCSLLESFDGIDEARPGNFVFYDWMQKQIGSCQNDDIALIMWCPVVAKHKENNEIILYGGGVHFSKEFITHNMRKVYGQMIDVREGQWGAPLDHCYLRSLSQEHGILKVNESQFDRLNPGDFAPVIPIHSCMTANLMKKYYDMNFRLV